MDITKEIIERIERKTLGEDCWISIGEDIRLKIDYLTRAQEMEFNRLSLSWNLNKGQNTHSHHLEYYMRCTVKDITGITIGGKETELIIEDGLAKYLVTEEIKKDKLPDDDPQKKRPLDFVKSIVELGLSDIALYKIFEKLAMTEADKKKLQSVQNSVKQESSDGQEKSSEVATY